MGSGALLGGKPNSFLKTCNDDKCMFLEIKSRKWAQHHTLFLGVLVFSVSCLQVRGKWSRVQRVHSTQKWLGSGQLRTLLLWSNSTSTNSTVCVPYHHTEKVRNKKGNKVLGKQKFCMGLDFIKNLKKGLDLDFRQVRADNCWKMEQLSVPSNTTSWP